MKSKFFYTLALALAFTFAASLSACAQNTKDQPTTIAQKLQTIKLKVGGITCSGDCKDIEKVVSKTNGVTSAKLMGKPSSTSVFEITFDPELVSEKAIRKIVEGTPGCDNPDEKPYKVKG